MKNTSAGESTDLSVFRKKANRRIQVLCAVMAGLVVLFGTLFVLLDGPDAIRHRINGRKSYLTVTENGTVLPAETYTVSFSHATSGKNGYVFPTDYGEVRGIVSLSGYPEIDCGFNNVNNWHCVHLALSVSSVNGMVQVCQTVSYPTDDDCVDVLTTTQTAATAQPSLSVFREGI